MGASSINLRESLSFVERGLRKNIDDTYMLADFDDVILKVAIGSLQTLEEKLKKAHFIDNPSLTASNARRSLENIRKNDSLRGQFEIINNQCVVLLVSLFSSAIGDLFRESIKALALSGASQKLNDEELKLTIAELVDPDFGISDRIGRLLEEKKDISFQDMRSISRAFSEYFSVEIPKDTDVNNIIMAQAGRHVIVHEGAGINERLRKQVKGAVPRTLMPVIPTSGKLLFDVTDLRVIGDSMFKYFCNLRGKVEESIEVSTGNFPN